MTGHQHRDRGGNQRDQPQHHRAVSGADLGVPSRARLWRPLLPTTIASRTPFRPLMSRRRWRCGTLPLEPRVCPMPFDDVGDSPNLQNLTLSCRQHVEPPRGFAV